MSYINSIFELLDTMAQENNKESLEFEMVFEPVLENGNRRSNLTNITFKFKEGIENIKFISSLKTRTDFPMDLYIHPISLKFNDSNVVLLYKEFNNIKRVDLSPDTGNNYRMPYPTEILNNYHRRVFNVNRASNQGLQKEIQIIQDYCKLPSISFLSEDPFLFLNIYNYLKNKDFNEFKTKFTFKYSYNDLLTSISQSLHLRPRIFEEDSIKRKAQLNWNIFTGYEGMGINQFICSVTNSKVVHLAKINSNINYNYTRDINLCWHHSKLIFLPDTTESVMDLELFGSNQYIINSIDHGFIYYSHETKETTYSGIYLKDFPNLFNIYSKKMLEDFPDMPEDGINFLFRTTLSLLINTLYCLVHKDIDVIQEKIIFELLHLSKMIFNILLDKAPSFFKDFTLAKMIDLNINAITSVFRYDLLVDDEVQEQLDTQLRIPLSTLFKSKRFFSLVGKYSDGIMMEKALPSLKSRNDNGCFVELMSYIQKQIEPDESKILYLEKLNLGNTFKSTEDHFIYKKKNCNRLETLTLPLEFWRVLPFNKKLDLILIDDTPLKSKKIKYLTKQNDSQIIIFKDMVAEFYFRNLNLDLYTSDKINIRWLSEITFTDEELEKNKKIVNTRINGGELKSTEELLYYYKRNLNLGHALNNVTLDLGENMEVSIVAVLIDKNNNIAETSNSTLANTSFISSFGDGIFYSSLSNFIKKIVTEKTSKPTRIIFCTKSTHSKLIKNGAIDFLELKNSSYYGKVHEFEKILGGRYIINPNLISLYTSLTYNIINRSRLKKDYEESLFNRNINGTYREIYSNNLAIILNKFIANDKLKNYPFINFFINKGHPLLSISKARPDNTNRYILRAFGIDVEKGKATNSFIDIKNIENKIIELLFSTKEFQNFGEVTRQELEKQHKTTSVEDLNFRLAEFKIDYNHNSETLRYLLDTDYENLQKQEDYQEFLMTQFNNLLIIRFKYQLNLKNNTIIELFKLFKEFDQLIINNYKEFYYNNTGINLEIPEELEESKEPE